VSRENVYAGQKLHGPRRGARITGGRSEGGRGGVNVDRETAQPSLRPCGSFTPGGEEEDIRTLRFIMAKRKEAGGKSQFYHGQAL